MHIYCKYTKTKLISLFNVIPLDFNATIPTFHKSFNSVREKSFWVASLTNFVHRANDFIGWKSSSKSFFHWAKNFELAGERDLDTLEWNEPKPHLPCPKKIVSIILPADGWLLNFLATGDVGCFQATLWALLAASYWCSQVWSAVTIRSKNWSGAKLVDVGRTWRKLHDELHNV
jgi:hypothetical protein